MLERAVLGSIFGFEASPLGYNVYDNPLIIFLRLPPRSTFGSFFASAFNKLEAVGRAVILLLSKGLMFLGVFFGGS